MIARRARAPPPPVRPSLETGEINMTTKLDEPVTFECACGEKQNAVGPVLPDGWAIRAGSAVCSDCAIAPARGRRPRRVA